VVAPRGSVEDFDAFAFPDARKFHSATEFVIQKIRNVLMDRIYVREEWSK